MVFRFSFKSNRFCSFLKGRNEVFCPDPLPTPIFAALTCPYRQRSTAYRCNALSSNFLAPEWSQLFHQDWQRPQTQTVFLLDKTLT